MANLAGSRVHGGWLMVGAVVVFYGAARATMGELDRRNTRPL